MRGEPEGHGGSSFYFQYADLIRKDHPLQGYTLLYKWFVGLQPDAEIWDATTFTKNRQRFHEHGRMQAFFEGTMTAAIQKEAAANGEFSVGGTLIQAWGSLKSFRPKEQGPKDGDSNQWSGFGSEKRSNASHESKTDPEALLKTKGNTPAQLSHALHVLMEHDRGLLMGILIAAS